MRDVRVLGQVEVVHTNFGCASSPGYKVLVRDVFHFVGFVILEVSGEILDIGDLDGVLGMEAAEGGGSGGES